MQDDLLFQHLSECIQTVADIYEPYKYSKYKYDHHDIIIFSYGCGFPYFLTCINNYQDRIQNFRIGGPKPDRA